MKKIMLKKLTAAACIVAMTVAMSTACQKSDTAKDSTVTSEVSNTDKENGEIQNEETGKPVKIHILNRVNAEVIVEDNPIIKELEDKLNVDIEYEAPPINNYNEKLQISMAAGNIPDIIYNWGGADTNYEQWAGDGLLAELDDKIQNYPNIMATVPEDYWPAIRSTKTGKIHAIPKCNIDGYWGLIINQQWLDNLGLKAPTNLQELKEVSHQFTYNDPDKNGKNDTYGLTYAMGTFVDIIPLKAAFGLIDTVKDTDGQYKIKQMKSGYIPYLTYIRELYADGVLDPEFFTNAYAVDEEKLVAGSAGIKVGHQVDVLGMLGITPDACERFTYIAPPANDNGERNCYLTPSMWGTWMISADADVDKCLELIDYGMSKEGFMLMSLGKEGVNYNSYDYDTKSLDMTAEQETALKGITSSYFTITYAKDGSAAIVENATTKERLDKYYNDYNAMKSVIKEIRVPSIKAPLYTTFEADNPDLITKLSELEVQYIVGDTDLTTLEEFLNNTYLPAAEAMNTEYVQWLKDYDAAN